MSGQPDTPRPGRAAWTRLGAGVLAVGLLTWGSLEAGGWGPGSDGGAEAAARSAGGPGDDAGSATPDAPVLVEEARLGCTGASGLQSTVAFELAPQQLLGGEPAESRPASLVPVGERDATPQLEGDVEGGLVSVEETGAALLTGTGEGAPGLVGGVLSVGTGTDEGSRGAALVGCAAPAAEHWLLGGDAAAGRTEQVVLTNPGADPVQVDLEVNGAEGPVETTGGSGLVVPAGGQLVRALDALAPGTAAPAVRVHAEGGPVVAHLVDASREGTTDLGLDVTGPSAPAARDLVIPPLPGADEGEEVVLRLLAPEADAVVELGALTEDGAATPGIPAVRLTAGATTDVPLEELPDGAVGLRLRSDQPVAAALQIRVAPSGEEPLEQTEQPGDGAGATEQPGDEADATEEPGDEDGATATAEPDEQDQPLVRPAGELAWLPAVAASTDPVGIAVPETAAVPDAELVLSVGVLDATEVEVLLRAADGSTRGETLDLDNDSTSLLAVPADVRGIWVRPVQQGGTGVVAAVHLTGRDELGAYRAAADLAPVPWSREVTRISAVVP
ncbi:Putative secreted protein [Serinicoccus hydrothermalis]|uniref:Secreted protein n=1 Tax=Serinicoccus hydrothermalis TaxID=1758689 RepID=A0A1B1NAH1_9MICO|nr:DUF5719 family protein [Serinicoccus hydrothermalis]ANS78426.1 Putative secreted protein [Serinicoccus hydrothermalis]